VRRQTQDINSADLVNRHLELLRELRVAPLQVLDILLHGSLAVLLLLRDGREELLHVCRNLEAALADVLVLVKVQARCERPGPLSLDSLAPHTTHLQPDAAPDVLEVLCVVQDKPRELLLPLHLEGVGRGWCLSADFFPHEFQTFIRSEPIQ
jgi:hypothetical protein